VYTPRLTVRAHCGRPQASGTTRKLCELARKVLTTDLTRAITGGLQLVQACGHQMQAAKKRMQTGIRKLAKTSAGCLGAVGGFLPLVYWPGLLLELDNERGQRPQFCSAQLYSTF